MTATKTPSRRWRVAVTAPAERAQPPDSARPYSSQDKAYEAVRAFTSDGVPATVWHYEGGRGSWVLYERIDANGEPA